MKESTFRHKSPTTQDHRLDSVRNHLLFDSTKLEIWNGDPPPESEMTDDEVQAIKDRLPF